MNYQHLKIILGGNMYKIAITLRKKEDHMTFFMNDTYYQFLSPYFDIEIVVPRKDRQYQDVVDRNNALLICGGNDIDPHYYHQESHHSNTLEDHLIETMDFDIFQQFYEAKKPILGICRGIQVINILFHGSLYQDIPSQYPTLIQHNKDYHHVLIQKDTLLSRYFPSQIKVNSSHHQNIKDVPKTLKISAISEDGLIEGIENNQILAVQWHPERMDEHHQKQFIQYILDFIQNHS